MSKKTTTKKSTARKSSKKSSMGGWSKGTGYKGHRVGSLKEKIHQLYDKHGPEKARPMALKLVAPATVATSWS
ncbi:hypothetical protein [Bradyrhizobium jicamae]|uniref:hypothetical protein n=1 Tax=Bradyrhizobium jicamae TaxID=280332 RepID=UPI000B2DDD84|nr:hypothetical protein [Bradyrhizobium jicamae]